MAKKKQKTLDETIEAFRYRIIEKGFYEVIVISAAQKIMLEGKCCSGIFLEIIKKAREDKAEIERVNSRTSILMIEEEMDELKMYRTNWPKIQKGLNQAIKTLQKVQDF